MMSRLSLCALLAVTGALAQVVPVANPDFTDLADGQPVGWRLAGGAGQWLPVGSGGPGALAVTGTGRDSNYWQSNPLALAPGTLYRLQFAARSLDQSGGTAITGPVFANRDLGGLPADWATYSSVFATPADLPTEQSWIRFGQWHASGTLEFDRVRLQEVQAIHHRAGSFELGAGESLAGNQYTFEAPLGHQQGNASRPLVRHQCGFNTHRWVFGANSSVVYRHHLSGRRQTAAKVTTGITWYAGGALAVEASADGTTWQPLGRLSELGADSFTVPSELLPAEAIWIRLRALAAGERHADSDPGSFQVAAYRFDSTYDGPPIDLTGETRYLAVSATDPALRVAVEQVGQLIPGGANQLAVRVTAAAAAPPAVTVSATVKQGETETVATTTLDTLPTDGRLVELAVPVERAGAQSLTIRVNGFAAELDFVVPDLHSSDYGELLPGNTDAVAVWGCSSGWKVSRTRPAPTTHSEALQVAAAGGEVEAVQLVLRPRQPLSGLTVTPTALSGPAGATLAAESVEVLRVGYVPIAQPTDAVGSPGDWPDPLPPLTGPIDLPADRNQPLWVRVRVPRGSAAGRYQGSLRLTAAGWSAEVPLAVLVHGFDLPQRMTCETAFGFTPQAAFQYHGARTPQQQREVLEAYWKTFSEHHISPYDPAPLDRFTVNWPGVGSWSGSLRRDREVKYAGESSLVLDDASETSNVAANYTERLPIGPAGFRLSFWYRTMAPDHAFLVTLQHQDADGRWMSGRNNDIRITGNGQWQEYTREITRFPEGAASVQLYLRPTLWSEEGTTLGKVWFDDISLLDRASGRELLADGGFEPLGPDALRPTFDFTAWDRAMGHAIDELGFNSFRLPILGLGGGTFHARYEPTLLGYGEDDPEYHVALAAYLRGLEAHLAERGWLDEAYVYWFDEPDPKDYEFVMNGFRKLREHAPRLRRMLTEQIEPELIGGPNLWCPLTPHFSAEAAAARRAEGEQFWWYVCTGPKAPYATLFIDHPATELRVWLWQTWEREIDGILVWATNYWSSSAAYPDPNQPQNPYLDPMSWVSGYSTPAGSRRPWGNGDGRFIYPPEAGADGRPDGYLAEPPVDSLRWEMLRDGIEDYEYFVILRRLLAERGDRLSPAERDRLAGLLVVPETVSASLTSFTTRPEPLEEHRRLVAEAIERLQP